MKVLLNICIACLIANYSWGQDAHFTAFQNTMTYYNPACNGLLVEGDYRISNANKRQWKKVVKPARATNLSFDLPLFRYSALEERTTFLGLGANVFSERFGSQKFTNTHASLGLMGGLRMGNHKVTVGISVGSGRQSVNFGEASWDSQFDGYAYDPSLPSNESIAGKLKANYMDVGTGVAWLWQSDKNLVMLSGLSYQHANAPSTAMDGLQGTTIEPKITLHNRTEIPLDFRGFKRMGLSLFGLYGMQGPHTEMLGGGALKIYLQEASRYTYLRGNTSIELGAAYRYGDAIALIANFHKDNYNIGFSYDITTSALKNAVSYRGGLEVSFTYFGMMEYFHTVRRGR